jgi:PIN domain nuclease of toxin-antitoxin system
LNPTFLDTHVVIWLRENRLSRLSGTARREIERADALLCSPVVKLELAYLEEIGRLKISPQEMLDAQTLHFSIGLSSHSLAEVCAAAESVTWVRDLFDRLIVAEAMVAGAKLVTADAHILKHYKKAVW